MASVIQQLLNGALSDLTSKAYQKGITRFHDFCSTHLHISAWFPAKTPAVVSFVAFCFQGGFAPASIASTLSAISYVHKMHIYLDPTAAFVVRKLFQGATKLMPSCDQRAPITQAILNQLVDSTQYISISYYDRLLTSAMYLLAFHAFLRIGEIAAATPAQSSTVLQFSQIAVTSSDCSVVFHTYKHYSGPPVTLSVPAHADSALCPVKAMRLYIAVRGNSPGPLFMFPGGAPVSKSFFSVQLKKSLTWAGLPHGSYKGHSFRIGAATTAAMRGMSDEEIQRMGRWKSQAFRKYIRITMLHLHSSTAT